MSKRVIFHIGHGKTGTSAIQKFMVNACKDNRNFAYAKTARAPDGGHHTLYSANHDTYDLLLQEITQCNVSNFVISSETGLPNMRHFSQQNDYKFQFFSELAQTFNVYVIYYVRNHFDILESAFLQYIEDSDKSFYRDLCSGDNEIIELARQRFTERYFNPGIDAKDWINNAPTRQFDYFSNINDFWEPLLGRDNIITKVYNKDSLLSRDVVTDFLSLLSFELDLGAREKIENNITPAFLKLPRHFIYDASTIEKVKYTFAESAVKYAKRYLNTHDAKLLTKGF